MVKVLTLIRLVKKVCYYLFVFPFYKTLFKKIGWKTVVLRPLSIEGYENIALGKDVTVGKYSWLAALPLSGTAVELCIGDGSRIGNFNHIYATQKILIGKKVLTADKVYISDNLHRFDRVDMAILDQPIRQLAPVSIGDGTWLGENVCVLGASIGRNCVIGSNSVVTKDVPDFCVAVGSPARVIKRFCSGEQVWKRVDESGNFINK
jgi:acetyltransferase-like isoleucine patch superfamily enzyme